MPLFQLSQELSEMDRYYSVSPLQKSPIRILFLLDPFNLSGYFDFLPGISSELRHSKFGIFRQKGERA